jgi:hypothetical protein
MLRARGIHLGRWSAAGVLFHVRQLVALASPMITLPALAKWLNLYFN